MIAASLVNPAIIATATFSVVPRPAITSFSSSRTEVLKSQSASLTAVFANGKALVDHGVGAVASGVPVNVIPLNSIVYILTVTNPAGTSVATGLELTVDSTVAIGVLPSSARVHPGRTQSFHAMVTGTLDQAIAWSVQEKGGGDVSALGLYRAPARTGAYHVVATSVMDPSKTAVVPIVVIDAWGTAAPIEPETSIPFHDAYHPRFAFDGSGNGMAVWQQSDGSRFKIWANRYVPGSGWGSATLIEPADAGDSQFPQIAWDGSGNAMAVWQQNDGTQYNIWANRYVPGSAWGSETLIETIDAGNSGFPQIAFDGSGNALVLWEQFDGTQYNIWANRYVTGSGWGFPTRVDPAHPGNSMTPQIAFDGNGDAMAVWTQANGTQFNIWVNGYR